MDHYIVNLINTIENRLFDDFNIEELPPLYHISSMQMYRDFYSTTGYSIKEYTRRRRLSYALHLIKYTDIPLINIAYDSGYSSQQTLCRVVKKYTGLTPLQYKNSDMHFFFPKFEVNSSRQIKVETETLPETIQFNYYSSKLKGIEDRCLKALFELVPNYDGRIFGRDGKQLGAQFSYIISLENKNLNLDIFINSEFIYHKTIPSHIQVYAKTTVNTDEDILNAWDFLYSHWLTKSMFQQDSKPYFEEFIHRNHTLKKLELYIPVKKKYDIHSIKMKHYKERLFLVATVKGYKSEERASKKVVEFINDYNPYLLNNASTFYVDKNVSATCGIEIDFKIKIPPGSGLELIKKNSGVYAVYEGGCLADPKLYKERIIEWAEENGLPLKTSDAFSIYDIKGDYDSKNITTKVCIPLKDVKK